MYLKAGKKFSCTYGHLKLRYYSSFNALYSRSKSSNSELVSIELVKSFCLPVLLYGIEVTDVFNMLNNLINRTVHKIHDDVSTEELQDERRGQVLTIDDWDLLMCNNDATKEDKREGQILTIDDCYLLMCNNDATKEDKRAGQILTIDDWDLLMCNMCNTDATKKDERLRKLINNSKYISSKKFENNLTAVHSHKGTIRLNKPIYAGLAVLDLSKLWMYQFYYKLKRLL